MARFVVDERKADKSLDFIWRASTSLSDQSTEIFTHIYESYYCMPLPTYAFEWGAAKGAKIPNAGNVVLLAKGLADIAHQRAAWCLLSAAPQTAHLTFLYYEGCGL